MRAAWLTLVALLPAVPDELEWRDDLKAATEEAAASGKPLFVLFRCES